MSDFDSKRGSVSQCLLKRDSVTAELAQDYVLRQQRSVELEHLAELESELARVLAYYEDKMNDKVLEAEELEQQIELMEEYIDDIETALSHHIKELNNHLCSSHLLHSMHWGELVSPQSIQDNNSSCNEGEEEEAVVVTF